MPELFAVRWPKMHRFAVSLAPVLSAVAATCASVLLTSTVLRAANPPPRRPNDPPEIEIKGSRLALPPGNSPDKPAAIDARTPPAQRLPVPEEAKRLEAEKLVREVFEKDFAAAKKSPEKLALALTLLKHADDSKDDPAGKYVLLTMSRDLAIAAGDPTMVMRVADRLADAFNMDRRREKASDLGKLVGTVTTPAAQQALVDAALSQVEETAGADDYEAALKLARLALDAANKLKDAKLIKLVTERGKELAAQQKEFAPVVAAEEKLQTDPTNAAANSIAGRWYWFAKNDPNRAMSYLALSDDKELKDAAIKDLSLPPDSAAQLELADLWWDIAQPSKDERAKNAVLVRSFQWYSQALPNLIGLKKAKAEKRIGEIRPLTAKIPVTPLAKPGQPTEPKPADPSPAEPKVQIAKGEATDLLKLIDPKSDAVEGTWRLEGGKLTSPVSGFARIHVPFKPPEEYVLSATVRRVDGNDNFAMGLIMGGHRFSVGIDSFNGTKTGMELINGQSIGRNDTTKVTSGNLLKAGQKQQIMYTVRKNQVVVKCDDKVLIDWTGDPAKLTTHQFWAVPKPDQLFIGARSSTFEISKLEIKPLESAATK